jgi:multidrug efflux system membrane fusion protein
VRKHQASGELTVQVMREQGSDVLGSGKLVFIDNTVNAQTGTIVMKARMPNDRDLLWPGQFVAVRVVLTTEPSAVILPEAAVQPGQQGPFVYVFQPGEEEGSGRARVQQIQIDRQFGDKVVVASGLKGGERVITEVPPGLSPNAPVRLPGKGDGKGGRKGGKGGDGAKGEAAKGAPEAAKGEAARGEGSPGESAKGGGARGEAGKAASGDSSSRREPAKGDAAPRQP